MAILRRLILRDCGQRDQRSPPIATSTPSCSGDSVGNGRHVPQDSLLGHLPVETGPLAQLHRRRVTVVLDLEYLARRAYRDSCVVHMDTLRRRLSERSAEFNGFGLTTRHDGFTELPGLDNWAVIVDRARAAIRYRDWRTPIALHTLYLAAWTCPEVLVMGTDDLDLRRIVTSALHVHFGEAQVYSISMQYRTAARVDRSIDPRNRWHISIGRDVVTTISSR